MPYIMEQDRLKYMETLINLPVMRTPGELNFVLSSICKQYLKYSNNDLKVESARYQTHNDVIGALEGCKMEMYRRYTAPYEDIKIVENGDLL